MKILKIFNSIGLTLFALSKVTNPSMAIADGGMSGGGGNEAAIAFRNKLVSAVNQLREHPECETTQVNATRLSEEIDNTLFFTSKTENLELNGNSVDAITYVNGSPEKPGVKHVLIRKGWNVSERGNAISLVQILIHEGMRLLKENDDGYQKSSRMAECLANPPKTVIYNAGAISRLGFYVPLHKDKLFSDFSLSGERAVDVSLFMAVYSENLDEIQKLIRQGGSLVAPIQITGNYVDAFSTSALEVILGRQNIAMIDISNRLSGKTISPEAKKQVEQSLENRKNLLAAQEEKNRTTHASTDYTAERQVDLSHYWRDGFGGKYWKDHVPLTPRVSASIGMRAGSNTAQTSNAPLALARVDFFVNEAGEKNYINSRYFWIKTEIMGSKDSSAESIIGYNIEFIPYRFSFDTGQVITLKFANAQISKDVQVGRNLFSKVTLVGAEFDPSTQSGSLLTYFKASIDLVGYQFAKIAGQNGSEKSFQGFRIGALSAEAGLDIALSRGWHTQLSTTGKAGYAMGTGQMFDYEAFGKLSAWYQTQGSSSYEIFSQYGTKSQALKKGSDGFKTDSLPQLIEVGVGGKF